MGVISEPRVSLDIIPAVLSPQNTPEAVLFVGQMKTGTATAGTLVEDIGVAGEEDALFGANSCIAAMIRAARKINKATRFDALPLADHGSGVAATGTLALVGPATAAGTYIVTIGSTKNHRYEIAVANADTATIVGAAIAAAVNADTRCPVTAVNVTGTVTFTAVNKGTLGNKITLRLEGVIAGLTPTLTGMASGATDPVLTNVFDPIVDRRYQTISWPNTFTAVTVMDFLDDRFNTPNDVLDGVAITSHTDTFSSFKAAVASLNSQSYVALGNKKVNDALYKGSSLLELDDVIASQFAAVRALRLTSGADISRYVISANGALDAFGGMELASLPYANTPFYNLPLIATGKGFTSEEIDELNAAGGCVLGNNRANNEVIAGRIYTTYKTDSAGNPDPSFTFLNFVDTMSVIREFYFVNLKARFAQCRLTLGALEEGRNMANKEVIEAECDGLYVALSKFVLTQSGPEALKFFRRNRVVTIDISTGDVGLTMVPPIVGQVRNIRGTLQIAFGTVV